MSTETSNTRMFTSRRALVAAAALLGAMAVLVSTGVVSPLIASAQDEAYGSTVESRSGFSHRRTVAFDVAENGHKFVFDEAPVLEGAGELNGFPAAGNTFSTEGYLYPAGTLTDSNGVNPDGSPEFPDKVIGEWQCRGVFINEGMATIEGAMVYTTQMFSFGDDPQRGKKTVTVTGYEGAVPGEQVNAAITGGTGRYAAARGEAKQTFLGANNPEASTMGINKQVKLRISR